MKSPREILLARHCSADPKLDAVRQRVMTTLTRRAAPTEPRTNRLVAIGREFFRLPRVAWSSLAAAWVVIIALNVATSEAPQGNQAGQESIRSPETLEALREQKRLFSELVGSDWMKTSAAPFQPRPRSERPPQLRFA